MSEQMDKTREAFYSEIPLPEVAMRVKRHATQIQESLKRTVAEVLEIGRRLTEVKEMLDHGQFLKWIEIEFEMSQSAANRFMHVHRSFGKLPKLGNLPDAPSVLYELASPSFPEEARQELVSGGSLEIDGKQVTSENITVADAKRLKRQGTETEQTGVREMQGEQASNNLQPANIQPANGSPGIKRLNHNLKDIYIRTGEFTPPKFNQTNDRIEWATWTWNPVTGCYTDCEYCYARDIANRFTSAFPMGFAPTFHPDRLQAPSNTKVPETFNDPIGLRNVFVCSMADLFGNWVPTEWIDQVLDAVRQAPRWNFIFLTKFPGRLPDFRFPPNSWVGTTIDRQIRVELAEKVFLNVKAPIKFVSCEPMLEPIHFNNPEVFDWIIVGGRSRVSQCPEFQPKWEWVESLLNQARNSGVKAYFKPNLTARPREYPQQPQEESK